MSFPNNSDWLQILSPTFMNPRLWSNAKVLLMAKHFAILGDPCSYGTWSENKGKVEVLSKKENDFTLLYFGRTYNQERV